MILLDVQFFTLNTLQFSILIKIFSAKTFALYKFIMLSFFFIGWTLRTFEIFGFLLVLYALIFFYFCGRYVPLHFVMLIFNIEFKSVISSVFLNFYSVGPCLINSGTYISILVKVLYHIFHVEIFDILRAYTRFVIFYRFLYFANVFKNNIP